MQLHGKHLTGRITRSSVRRIAKCDLQLHMFPCKKSHLLSDSDREKVLQNVTYRVEDFAENVYHFPVRKLHGWHLEELVAWQLCCCKKRLWTQTHIANVLSLWKMLLWCFAYIVTYTMCVKTRSLAIANRPCDCCIILKSGSYTKAIIVLIAIFWSNWERRLTFRRVIIEQWMYTAQVPINIALVLSNLCEYRYKWYIAKNYRVNTKK